MVYEIATYQSQNHAQQNQKACQHIGDEQESGDEDAGHGYC